LSQQGHLQDESGIQTPAQKGPQAKRHAAS